MGNFIFGAVIAVLGLAYVGGWDPGNEARGEIVTVHQQLDIGVMDGAPDAGVLVKTSIKNVGQGGFIRVKAKLSTSEGEWEREQKLHFDANETKDLSWFFHEPTVNALNVQSWVQASPGVPTVKQGNKKNA